VTPRMQIEVGDEEEQVVGDQWNFRRCPDGNADVAIDREVVGVPYGAAFGVSPTAIKLTVTSQSVSLHISTPEHLQFR
jgi:hypothetical protein